MSFTNSQTVNTAGISISGWSFNFGAAGQTITLGSNFTSTSLFAVSHVAGTLVLNGFNMSVAGFQSTSGTRAISFGASNTITITAGNGMSINGTSFSYTGTSKIIFTGTASTNFTCSGTFTTTNALNIFVQTTAGTFTDSSAFYNNLDHTGCTGNISNSTRTIFRNFTAASGATYAAGTNVTTFSSTNAQTLTSNGKTLDFPITKAAFIGTLTISGDLTMGATRAFTINSGNTVALGANTLSCGILTYPGGGAFTFSGAGNITITGNNTTVFNQTGGGNFNSIPINFTYSGSVGTRTIAQSAANTSLQPTFNFTAGTDIINYNNIVTNGVAAVNFTGFAGTFNGNATVFAYNFVQNAATTVIVSGLKISNTNSYTLTSGTCQFGTSTNTFGSFLSNNSNTRGITFPASSIAPNLTGTGTVWNTSTLTGLTVTIGSVASNILLSGANPIFAGGGINLSAGFGLGIGVSIAGSSATTLTFTGANTFNQLSLLGSASPTITFPAGVATTIGSGGLISFQGSLSSVMLIRSSSSGTRAILSVPSDASATSFNYLNIQDSQAQGGATFTANDSTDNGNNTGWTFPPPVVLGGSNYFLLF
jgi:hypothetical protein